MSGRDDRVAIAQETLRIAEAGEYRLPDGRAITIGDDLAAAIDGTVLYHPAAIAALVTRDASRGPTGEAASGAGTTVEVRNCTTFAAARSLLGGAAPGDPLCLNFASARHPGGGFLSGSQAQEEALARASGLYPCLLTQPEYYRANEANRSSLYTDHLIYSPAVPVFRDDADRLVADPFLTSIVTAPAPNAGAVRQNQPDAVAQLGPTMARRIEAVLAVAVDRGHDRLVLGAWGCGVFGNDPAEVAALFAAALAAPRYATAFSHVVFAVLDGSADLATFGPFQAALG